MTIPPNLMCALGPRNLPLVFEQPKQSFRSHWQLEYVDAKRRQRIGQRVGDCSRCPNRAAFAHASKTANGGWRSYLKMLRIDWRHVTRSGYRVIDQTCSEDLARLIVDDLFVERGSDALSYRAVHLSVNDRRVNNTPAILRDDIAVERHPVCLWIDLQRCDMRRRGRCAENRVIEFGDLQLLAHIGWQSVHL